MARVGRRAVSAAVRRWVAHPASVRRCGEPHGGILPVLSTDHGPSVSNLVQCRNRFVDPYCSGWFRQELAERNAETVREHLGNGGDAVLLVHTCHHRAGHTLADVMDTHAKAWHKSRAGKRSKAWSGLAFWRAWDIVVGGRRGPHPHTNTIVLGPSGSLTTEWLGRISADWAAALVAVQARKLSLAPEQVSTLRENTLERGLLGVRITLGEVEVLTAYAARHVEGAAVEVADNANRQTRDDLGGATLMALACMAHAGQDDAGRLLASAAVDLEGKRSYSMSKLWPRAGMLDEDTDAEAVLVGAWVVGLLPAAQYRAHRAALDEFLDSMRGKGEAASLEGWRTLDSRLRLGIQFLDEPIRLDEWR